MPFNPELVETVLVDSYSTLVDELSTQRAFTKYTDSPVEAARLWDQRSTIYGLVANHFEEFPTARKKHEYALDHTIQTLGIDVSAEQRDELLREIDRMRVFEDTGSLETLTHAGYGVYVLSNGDPDMLATLVSHAGIEDVVSGTISAAEVGLYKPDRRLYRHAAAKAGAPVSGIAHVSSAWHDVVGAMRTGMQGVWLNRSNTQWEGILGEPTLEVSSIPAFVELLTDHPTH